MFEGSSFSGLDKKKHIPPEPISEAQEARDWPNEQKIERTAQNIVDFYSKNPNPFVNPSGYDLKDASMDDLRTALEKIMNTKEPLKELDVSYQVAISTEYLARRNAGSRKAA
jgi:hypothetical protein